MEVPCVEVGPDQEAAADGKAQRGATLVVCMSDGSLGVGSDGAFVRLKQTVHLQVLSFLK